MHYQKCRLRERAEHAMGGTECLECRALKTEECGGCRVHQDAELAVRYLVGECKGCALCIVQVHGVGRCSGGCRLLYEYARCKRVQGARRYSSKHVATVPASSNAVESEGRRMKQC
jgi:hypothetical protein